MFTGKFITTDAFADLTPIYLFHREGEQVTLPAHPDGLKNLHITFQGTLLLDVVKPTVLRFTADDYAKIYINGKFAAQGPAQGYPWCYNWCEADITPLLCEGENEIVADVYYCGLINRAYNSAELRCGFVCDLMSNGEVYYSTDENWRCRVDKSFIGHRTTGYETQYLEDRDLRIPLGAWEQVSVKTPDYTYANIPAPLLDVHTRRPVACIAREGSILYDFGQEMAGTLRMRFDGKAGDTVILRCGEELDHSVEGTVEGVLRPETQVRWRTRANCEYHEEMILADGENYIDQYEYKAFRYAELILPAGVRVLSFEAVERHYPLDDAACVLTCSDQVLQSVFALCKHGVRVGSQEVFVDCPGREKGQYAGDLTITSASQMWLSGDSRLFLKAVRDQVVSTKIDEGIMAVTPGSFMQEIADYSLQFPILALRAYEVNGDRAYLAELLPVCERMLAYFARYQREDGLLDGVDGKWNLVDWPQNLRDGYDFQLVKPIGKGVHNVINAFYIGAVMQTEQIRDILGVGTKKGEKRSEALIEAFNRCFWRPSIGLYADSEISEHASLHANVLPIFYGFAKPESHKAAVELIRKRFFASGVYMSYFTLKALARLEMWQDIWNFITSEGESSWYNMVREGNTCCIEAWGKEQKENTSLCHPWASAPIPIIIEDILGITPTAPAYADIAVCPHIPDSVEFLHMRVPLVDGRHVDFRWEHGSYQYRILR